MQQGLEDRQRNHSISAVASVRSDLIIRLDQRCRKMLHLEIVLDFDRPTCRDDKNAESSDNRPNERVIDLISAK